MNWPTLIGVVVALGVAPIFAKKFLKSCYGLDEEVPEKVRQFAQDVFYKKADSPAIITFYLSYFDYIFRPGAMLRPSFWRCAKFSFMVFVVISIGWLVVSSTIHPDSLQRMLSVFSNIHSTESSGSSPLTNILFVLVIVITSNIVGDFFSIWETRVVLEKLSSSKSTSGQVALWGLDICVSMLIFGMFLLPSRIILAALIWSPGGVSVSEVLQSLYAIVPMIGNFLFWDVFVFNNERTHIVFSICFYTTLSTTVWAGLSIVAIRLSNYFQFVRPLVKARTHPFGALTVCVIALLVALAVLLFLLSSVVTVMSGTREVG